MKKLLRSQTLRVIFKAGLLFLFFNYAFALIPTPMLWRLSVYNTLIPGRPRFPQEDDLSLIFTNHAIASSHEDEYNVVLLGHSSTWGYLLNVQDTLSGQISAKNLKSCDGQNIHLYNLGYPNFSGFKDLLILDQALSYQPDAVIWFITLKSMMYKPEQHPVILENADIGQRLIDQYDLPIAFENPDEMFSARTFLSRRAILARFIQYQLGGMRGFVAGEHSSPQYTPVEQDLEDTLDFDGMLPPELDTSLIMDRVLNAGFDMVGEIPLIVVNEPILLATGANSDIRYNEYYPRWAYDQYRALMSQTALDNNWSYLDFWDLVPPTEFTDSATHRTAVGEQILANKIEDVLLQISCP